MGMPKNTKPTDTTNYSDLSDTELVHLCEEGKIPMHNLEKVLKDFTRAVSIRRQCLSRKLDVTNALDNLPYKHFDYKNVYGACAENVIGYVTIPVGTAGPVNIDGKPYTLPMATTEGCLIASTHRGCKAINESGGAITVVTDNGMTRAPLIRLPSVARAAELNEWLKDDNNYYQVATAFNGTSRFARLKSVTSTLAGRCIHLRFKSVTGDAMGMNMVSKGVEAAVVIMKKQFPDLQVMSLSGNYCTDKKPSAVNWIEGRGKSVIAEATIKEEIVKKVLKTTVDDLIDLNINKNLVGSAMAGSIGGYNAHASNIVTAIYIATGQDPAQNVESSNCITLMEKASNGKDLLMSCSMPSIEVGTVGGGTHLPAQSSCLSILNVKGANYDMPGKNAVQLARVVCTGVLAGELSLMSALAAGHLVKSHLEHNRKKE